MAWFSGTSLKTLSLMFYLNALAITTRKLHVAKKMLAGVG